MTSTLVLFSEEASISAVMSAAALPAPRVSRPSARITIRKSSRFNSTMVALPRYSAEMGPTLTFTAPRNSSPSTSSRRAPGRHGAINSGFVRTSQARSTPTPTSKSLFSSIPQASCDVLLRPSGVVGGSMTIAATTRIVAQRYRRYRPPRREGPQWHRRTLTLRRRRIGPPLTVSLLTAAFIEGRAR